MAFVFSPSNMSTYRDCPLRFYGQSISKEIKWKASKQKSFGTLTHNAVEHALREGIDATFAWPDGLHVYYTQSKIAEARRRQDAGAQLLVEHELVIDNTLQPAAGGWWADNALLRARADVILLPAETMPDANTVYIYDIKTGRKWDSDHFQLRIEALLAHLIFKRPVIEYAYWYVQTGEDEAGRVDFSKGVLPVADIMELMKTMQKALKDNIFVPKTNKFCKWCDFYQTEKCGATL